ncbi:TIGR02530 family flagellar biosynthesis protein [Haloimpatiens sp. FM7315]|uniref:TIGR02530 family flagellar biosynthesis protein n=1 Tax=Haloimpatiens sp. FM7315 TaxID=3298609 RepID=UPI0035A2E6CD
MGYRVVNGKLYPVGNLPEINKISKSEKSEKDLNFKEIYEKAIRRDSFLVSKHAAERLRDRDIVFSKEDMETINKAINKAEEKGARECLILYKDTALITNIKNRTIITAVSKGEDMKVFTNVDTVVLV